MIKIRVTGIEDITKFTQKLEKTLQPRVHKKLSEYVNRHLVARIKSRLTHGIQPHTSAIGQKGLIGQAGGYGLPKNEQRYAEWKASRKNLPLTGSLSTRELVATGYFVENIAVTKATAAVDAVLFEIGPKAGQRPKIFPFRNVKDTDLADVSKKESNLKIAQFLEDSKYKFWAKEFEDVRKELEPFLTLVIVDLIKELVAEYSKGK